MKFKSYIYDFDKPIGLSTRQIYIPRELFEKELKVRNKFPIFVYSEFAHNPDISMLVGYANLSIIDNKILAECELLNNHYNIYRRVGFELAPDKFAMGFTMMFSNVHPENGRTVVDDIHNFCLTFGTKPLVYHEIFDVDE